ncbi:hypothetical protein V6N13_089628 [Hibiscus sabdariffa]
MLCRTIQKKKNVTPPNKQQQQQQQKKKKQTYGYGIRRSLVDMPGASSVDPDAEDKKVPSFGSADAKSPRLDDEDNTQQ